MDLKKLNKNVEIVNSKFAKYEDSEGNLSIFPISGLICNCQYLRVDESNLNIMKFNQEIDKNMKLKKVKTTTQVTKDTVTGKEEDKNTLVDQEVEVYEMWRVVNGLGMKEVFNDKKEALTYCNDINIKYLGLV